MLGPSHLQVAWWGGVVGRVDLEGEGHTFFYLFGVVHSLEMESVGGRGHTLDLFTVK